MEQPGQQQGQLQEQVAQLIGSLPGLLAGESEESLDDAVAAVSRLPVGVCAGLLQLPEPARRRAVLRHARGGAAAAGTNVDHEVAKALLQLVEHLWQPFKAFPQVLGIGAALRAHKATPGDRDHLLAQGATDHYHPD